jgi:two-component system, cell cycle response regulator DivK
MDGQPLILVVEHNLHKLELLDRYLKTFNCSCLCATKAVNAVILAQTHKPDLILLDMMLVDLSSNQVIDHLKRNPKTEMIPIIAVMPLTLVQDYDQFFIKGVDDYITKPYDFQKLEVIIDRYVSPLHSSNLLWE